MSKEIPPEVYELLQILGLNNFCVGQYVDGLGAVGPEVTITPFESRHNEIFYDVEYGNWIVPTISRPEAIPEDGFGIIVLLNSSGAPSSFGSFGHQAVLIGNERYGWIYVSKDQFESSILGPIHSPSKYVVKEFRSFAQFKASAHNYSLKDGYDSHSTIHGTGIDSLNYRIGRDSQGRPIERYDGGVFVPTDLIGNVAALAAAIQSAKKHYVLVFRGDCSDVPAKALRAAGKKDGEPSFWDGTKTEDSAKQAPVTKQNKILERNPDARRIK